MLRVAVARVIEATSGDASEMPAWLGYSERQRWTQLAPAARAPFAASRALLRELVQAATGVPAGAWDVSAQAGGAPTASVTRGDVASAAIHVSLSHRLGWVAAAVADAPVGVDIECERPPRSDPAERAALMLSPAERLAWDELAPDAREPALLARWTAKEAWFKASPPGTAPWDFRRVAARACAPAQANVRTWSAPPLHVALCCADARALSDARCTGLAPDAATSSWFVHRVAAAD